MDKNTLSEKVSKIQSLPDYETKEVVVSEIEALENFTDSERFTIFNNKSIIWILKNYTISELKKQAMKALKKPDIKVGDVIRFGLFRDTNGVVLEVCGENRDRVTVLYREDEHILTKEGISCYDVYVDKHVDGVSDILLEVK